ncbi:hypothetical protein NE237_014040 [Protea cynaroides]|uniref:Peroxiredoxin n=1 Tax=Protea cynaroides TaxID=273540 RepID=A0A9Q0JZJ3_9MAGN|nr:hypothetical protein NE237_014040 [Protea cynaroides]
MPGLTIGDTLPNLKVETNCGKFTLHDFVGQDWAIIFLSPGDFTLVCTIELAKVTAYTERFEDSGVKQLGGCKVKFPIIADPKREIIKELNLVDPDKKDATRKQIPSRALHVVAWDKKFKLSILYPATIERNVDETLRAVDALQKTANHKVATPVNWKPGELAVIYPSVSNNQAKEMFPHGYYC